MRGVGGEAHDAAAGGEVEGEGEGNPGECQVGSGERRMGRRSKGERSMEEVLKGFKILFCRIFLVLPWI